MSRAGPHDDAVRARGRSICVVELGNTLGLIYVNDIDSATALLERDIFDGSKLRIVCDRKCASPSVNNERVTAVAIATDIKAPFILRRIAVNVTKF